jgi:hypothetical protein
MKTLTSKELAGNLDSIMGHIKAQDATIKMLQRELKEAYGGEGSIDDKVLYHAQQIMKLLLTDSKYDLETVKGSGLESINIYLYDREDLEVNNICNNVSFIRPWVKK